MKPTIHINGTSVESLIEQSKKAYRAIGAAIDAHVATCPNARDYYPQCDGAYARAYAEWQERLVAMSKIRDANAVELEYLLDEQEKRRK